jgi:hypothetical protein
MIKYYVMYVIMALFVLAIGLAFYGGIIAMIVWAVKSIWHV